VRHVLLQPDIGDKLFAVDRADGAAQFFEQPPELGLRGRKEVPLQRPQAAIDVKVNQRRHPRRRQAQRYSLGIQADPQVEPLDERGAQFVQRIVIAVSGNRLRRRRA
jgi:hypothetical protein